MTEPPGKAKAGCSPAYRELYKSSRPNVSTTLKTVNNILRFAQRPFCWTCWALEQRIAAIDLEILRMSPEGPAYKKEPKLRKASE